MSQNQIEIAGVPMKQVDLDDSVKAFHIKSWGKLSEPKRMAMLRQIAMEGGRDPRIATLAIKIVRDRGVQPRDYEHQASAILTWVQDNIYYANEPGERLQDPVYTLRVKYGDCLPEDTKVIKRDVGEIALRDIRVGDEIWGRCKWTKVQAVWATGTKRVSQIRLFSGRTLRATENHKVFYWATDGQNARVAEAKVSELQEGWALLASGDHPTCIQRIDREVETANCYDLTTEDHYVYLPESDVVVHNCDDMAIILAALYESLRLPWRFVLSGKNSMGQVDRWIEGTPLKKLDFSHIYVVVGWPPFTPKRWSYAEPTLKGAALGWDVVKHTRAQGKSILPELAGIGLGSIGSVAGTAIAKIKEALPFEPEEMDLSLPTLASDVKKAFTPRRIVAGLIISGIFAATIGQAVGHLKKKGKK